MSTSQRIEVVNEHRRKAANGSMLHRRIADWVKQSSKPKKKHSFSKRRKSHNSLDEISLEFQERKNGNGGLNDSELGGESNQKKMEKQYFWDFNTVEQVLISCAILTCLAGVRCSLVSLFWLTIKIFIIMSILHIYFFFPFIFIATLFF